MNEAKDWRVTSSICGFYLFGILTACMIPICYAPQHLGILIGEFWRGLPLVELATADRSGASLVCITLSFLALARYFGLSGLRKRQKELLTHYLDDVPNSLLLSTELPAANPVGQYCISVKKAVEEKRPTGSDVLELLHRSLNREDARMRQAVTPLVVIGLLGTLLGVFIGFITAFGAGEQIELHKALQQAIVVVAAACLSSVWGIGLGQLLVGPLADQLVRSTAEVFDKAIELDAHAEILADKLAGNMGGVLAKTIEGEPQPEVS